MPVIAARSQTIYQGPVDGDIADAANWSEGLPVATGANAEALFNGSTPGTLNLTLGANLGERPNNTDGSYFRFTADQTDAVNIQSSGASRDINVRNSTTVSVFQMDAGAGAVTLGGGAQPMRFIVGNGVGLKTTRFTNNSSSLATFASNVSFLSGGGRSQDYFFLGTGTGGFNIGGPLQVNQAANDAAYTARVYVDMNGAAPLTLSGDNSGMTGEFRIQSGTVILGSNNALGTGNIDIRSDTAARVATLRSNGTARTIANNLVFSSSATGGGSILGGAGSGKLTFTGSTNWGAGAKTFTVDSSEVEFQGEWLGANATNRNTWIGTGVSDSILVLSGDRGTADKGIDFGDGLTVRLNHANSLGSDNTRTVQILGAASQSVVELENNITLARTLTVQGRDAANAAATLRNRSGNNEIALALATGGTRYNVHLQSGNLAISSIIGQTGTLDFYFSGTGNLTLPDWNDRRDLVMDGTANLTISGNSSHSGETRINSGNLRLGTGSATANLTGATTVTIESSASLSFANNSFLGFQRNISGEGSVNAFGSALVRFEGDNSGFSGTFNTPNLGVGAQFDGAAALGSSTLNVIRPVTIWAMDNHVIGNAISGDGFLGLGTRGTPSDPLPSNVYRIIELTGVVDHTGPKSFGTRANSEASVSVLINTSIAGGTTTVLAGSAIGGDGSLAGDLTLNDGARFVFNPNWTLDVAGSVTFQNPATFGVASLVNADGNSIDWNSIPDGRYRIIGTTATTFDNILNFGRANAFELGGDRHAYFRNSSLELVVTSNIDAETFITWIDSFSLNPAEAVPLATPAGDGISNLLKYALDLNPTVSSADLLPVAEIIEVSGDNYLSLTAVVRDDDADLSVFAEGSTDLVTWNLTVLEVAGVDQSGVPAGFVRKTWRLEDSISDESKAFLRLRADLVEQ